MSQPKPNGFYAADEGEVREGGKAGQLLAWTNGIQQNRIKHSDPDIQAMYKALTKIITTYNGKNNT